MWLTALCRVAAGAWLALQVLKHMPVCAFGGFLL